MKLLLMFFMCNIFVAVQAQNNQINLQRLRQKIAALKMRQGVSVNSTVVDTVKQFSDLASLFGKPGIHRLPQDHIPCIVPDTKAIAAIPNAWKGEVKSLYTPASPRMPNPAKPLSIVPPRPLTILPDAK